MPHAPLSPQVDFFVQQIKSARREAYQKQLAALSITEWWDEVKRAVIDPTIGVALAAFNYSGFSARKNKKNGVGVELRLEKGPSGIPIDDYLEFTLHGNDIKIESSYPDLFERWEGREYISVKVVTDKIAEFAITVAAKFPDDGKRSSTWG